MLIMQCVLQCLLFLLIILILTLDVFISVLDLHVTYTPKPPKCLPQPNFEPQPQFQPQGRKNVPWLSCPRRDCDTTGFCKQKSKKKIIN